MWPLDLSPKRLDKDWDRVRTSIALRSRSGLDEFDIIDLVEVLCFFQSYDSMLVFSSSWPFSLRWLLLLANRFDKDCDFVLVSMALLSRSGMAEFDFMDRVDALC